MMTCPQVLGEGVRTKRQFCDVLIGRDPAGGILITLPPHAGTVTLTFDLHNRHTYSEELVRTGKAYSRYTATIGVLTLDNTLISRAIVQNEFRTQADLVDRISGGSGASGLKAVAPTGTEAVVDRHPRGGDAGQHPRREAVGRAPGQHGHLQRDRPSDGHHQQRDGRVQAAAPAGRRGVPPPGVPPLRKK